MPFLRDAGADLVRRAWSGLADLAAIRFGQRAARRFGSFGEGSYIRFPMNVLFNEHCIHLGRGVLIGPHVTLSAGMVPGQRMLSDRVVAIGDGCVIGRGSEIAGHLSIELEDHVYTGPYVYITDHNHGWSDRSRPIGHQAAPERPVRIGSGSWLGQGSTVLPGVTIGRHAVVAAGAVVTKDVPDYAVVAGVPARVVIRART